MESVPWQPYHADEIWLPFLNDRKGLFMVKQMVYSLRKAQFWYTIE